MNGAALLVVPTGAANLASVTAAFRRLGLEPVVLDDPEAVRSAPAVVLPGVGSFGAAIGTLRERGLVEPLRARLAAGRPTLGICLGLQLLARSSQESPGVEGLGVIDADVVALRGAPRLPHMGWNAVRVEAGSCLLGDGRAYFANSFRLSRAPEGWTCAWTEYGEPFPAAIERGAVMGCQFHPELSGTWGRELLARWWRRATRPEGLPC